MKRFLILAVLLASCQMKMLDSSQTIRAYDKDYDRVYSSIVSFCAINGIPIILSDKQSGIISTAYSSNFYDVGWQLRHPIKYSFTIVAKEKSTIVYSTLYMSSGEQTDKMDEDVYLPIYSKMFDGISELLRDGNL